MENIKRLKKGEFLFKEGENTQSVFIIQSGKVSLNVDRGGRKLEITQLGPSQIIGEQTLFSNAKQLYSAEAAQETKVMEVPSDLLKAQFGQAPAGIKLLVKSLVDETRASRQALRSLKMETDKSPCPQVAIPRIFSLLNLVARHTGKINPENKLDIMVDWGVLKLYTARLFAESPQRMRYLADLLFKLKHVELVIGKNDEGHEELQKIHVPNIQLIEDFAEFYQFNLYKGQRAEVIYVDTLALKVAKGLITLGKDLQVDHRGAVKLDYNMILEEMKKQFHIDLKTTHLDALEKKGLFVKRSAPDQGPVTLAFDKIEFLKTVTYWEIIHEIDKWNDKGFVDLNETPDKPKEESNLKCEQCQGPIQSAHKFCPSCGFKLAA